MRPRREIGRMTLAALRPLFRYSYRREAWVLRLGGTKYGPVLVRNDERSANHFAKPSWRELEAERGRSGRTGDFADGQSE